jgi:hypothetical protein
MQIAQPGNLKFYHVVDYAFSLNPDSHKEDLKVFLLMLFKLFTAESELVSATLQLYVFSTSRKFLPYTLETIKERFFDRFKLRSEQIFSPPQISDQSFSVQSDMMYTLP